MVGDECTIFGHATQRITAYLTGGEIVVHGHGIGGVHEDLGYGYQVIMGLEPEAQEMAIYGLTADCLQGRRNQNIDPQLFANGVTKPLI